MKSPRFDIRAKKLQVIFSPKNIAHIWKEKVKQSMREQFICDGIENYDFQVNISTESEKLSQIILSGDYIPQRSQRILVEKSKGLCRQLVIPSVKDAIVLQCLSDALYDELKGKEPTKQAFFELRDHKFSSPPSGYGTFSSWLNFQKELFNFSQSRKFIVVTDIANYYDSISYIHLRNAISSITVVDECVIDMLIYVLSDMLWQPDYTPRIEVGLPQINLDAPRLLAHCFLYELDEHIASDPNRDFARYMDDIDIGVDSIVEAKRALKTVDLVLQTKQVRLNSGKTLILTRQQAIQHFRIIENVRLGRVQASIDRRIKLGLPVDIHRGLVQGRIRQGLRRKSFDTGSGEKILKRWLGLAAKTKAELKPKVIESFVRLRPSVRQNVYHYIRSFPLKPSMADALARVSETGLLIDDAAKVEMANNFVETFVPNKRCHKQIIRIIESSDPDNYFGLYTRIWLQSKYGDPSDVLITLKNSKNVWSSHERLGRLAGSLFPLFRGGPDEGDFRNLLSESLNPGVRETFNFHSDLAKKPAIFKQMFATLKASNPSRGTEISHAKFLCLLSALANTEVPASQVAALRNSHVRPFNDAYYKSISKRLGV